MTASPDALTLLMLAVLTSVVLALLTSIIAGLLAHLDGATLPRVLLRAGTAFGSTLLLLAALLTLATTMLN